MDMTDYLGRKVLRLSRRCTEFQNLRSLRAANKILNAEYAKDSRRPQRKPSVALKLHR